jgi:hypothetical protein
MGRVPREKGHEKVVVWSEEQLGYGYFHPLLEGDVRSFLFNLLFSF